MPIVTGALIGGAAILGGNIFSAKQAKDASDNQINFQREMAWTEHQREVQDLRAAGLNPILSATGGSGNAVPGGAQPQKFVELDKAVSSAAQLANVKADTTLKRENANFVANDAYRSSAQRTNYESLTDLALQQRETERHRTNEAEWNARSARWNFERARGQGEFERAIGPESRGMRLFLETLRSLR